MYVQGTTHMLREVMIHTEIKSPAELANQFNANQFGLCMTKAGTGCARFHQGTHGARGMQSSLKMHTSYHHPITIYRQHMEGTQMSCHPQIVGGIESSERKGQNCTAQPDCYEHTSCCVSPPTTAQQSSQVTNTAVFADEEKICICIIKIQFYYYYLKMSSSSLLLTLNAQCQTNQDALICRL